MRDSWEEQSSLGLGRILTSAGISPKEFIHPGRTGWKHRCLCTKQVHTAAQFPGRLSICQTLARAAKQSSFLLPKNVQFTKSQGDHKFTGGYICVDWDWEKTKVNVMKQEFSFSLKGGLMWLNIPKHGAIFKKCEFQCQN